MGYAQHAPLLTAAEQTGFDYAGDAAERRDTEQLYGSRIIGPAERPSRSN